MWSEKDNILAAHGHYHSHSCRSHWRRCWRLCRRKEECRYKHEQWVITLASVMESSLRPFINISPRSPLGTSTSTGVSPLKTQISINSGSFNTSELRPWYQPRASNSKEVTFDKAYASPPSLAIGLYNMDIGAGANIR